MKLKFDKYTIEKHVYDGKVSESVNINLGIVLNEVLATYKKQAGMSFDSYIIKISEHIDEFGNPLQNSYLSGDMEKIVEKNVEYAVVKEWADSTPHGSIYRIKYESEGIELAYKIQTALQRIEEILNK